MTGLLQILTAKFRIRLSEFNGGNLRNAIPREAFAYIMCDKEYVDDIKRDMAEYIGQMNEEYSSTDPGIDISLFFKCKEISSVLGAVKYIRCGLIYGHCPGKGGCFRLVTGMKQLTVKVEIFFLHNSASCTMLF